MPFCDDPVLLQHLKDLFWFLLIIGIVYVGLMSRWAPAHWPRNNDERIWKLQETEQNLQERLTVVRARIKDLQYYTET